MTQRTKKKISTAEKSIPPIFSVKYRGIAILSVSARDLHSALHLNHGCMSWIHSRIQKSRLLDGREYFPARIRVSQGQWHEDYYLPLSTAKALCMLEGSGVAAFVRRGLIEIEQKINRLTPLVTLKKTGHNARVDQRAWYWTIRKLESMFSNGVLFQPGEMYQAATKINQEISEELDQALRKEFSYIKKRGAERSHYIEQWKPEFAKLLSVESNE
ncbi:MAG: antA/AntB antirepressor family protein [Methylococcaceae bacterium]|nr:antA/AntB antirepressor family protein [Methylococcaceae bacterium]